MSSFTPRIKKKNLLVIAGGLWLFAGTMVSKLGLEVILKNTKGILPSLTAAIIVFCIFFNLIFKPLVNKHTQRIKNKESEKLCLFSFFDTKSYIIMIAMMLLGVSIRSMTFINPIYWAPFYTGIGSSLLLAGVLFLLEWNRWR